MGGEGEGGRGAGEGGRGVGIKGDISRMTSEDELMVSVDRQPPDRSPVTSRCGC